MARKKKIISRPGETSVARGKADSPEREFTATATAVDSSQLRLKHYLLMNAGFAAFCIIQYIIVTLSLPDSQGVLFFFALLIVAFATVSLTDYWFSVFKRKVPN